MPATTFIHALGNCCFKSTFSALNRPHRKAVRLRSSPRARRAAPAPSTRASPRLAASTTMPLLEHLHILVRLVRHGSVCCCSAAAAIEAAQARIEAAQARASITHGTAATAVAVAELLRLLLRELLTRRIGRGRDQLVICHTVHTTRGVECAGVPRRLGGLREVREAWDLRANAAGRVHPQSPLGVGLRTP